MAFRGENEHNLDSKDRLTIPSRHRDQLEDGVVMMRSLDPCIAVYPAATFQTFIERSLGDINPLGGRGRKMMRRLNSHSHDDSLDSAGRIRIPQGHLDHAGLSGACVVIGVGEYLEIWDPERWAAEEADIDATADDLAEELAAASDGAA